jgi:hypothetical protein
MSRWNTNERASMLGETGDMGNHASQHWLPQRLSYYQRQWQSQKGAWGDPEEVSSHLSEDVSAVIAAFRNRGTKAGLEVARRRGLEDAARVYLEARSETEEQLAVRLARIRARLARQPNAEDQLREAFISLRLEEVRRAGVHTPPQAVLDQPDLPRKTVARWVPYAALTVGVIALVRSFR